MVPAKRSLKGFVIAYFLIFGITLSSYAQARIAIVGGVNESTVIQTSNQPDFSNYKTGYSPRVGFHIGLMGDFPLAPKSKFSFQPGIEFFNKGRKFQQITKNGVGDTAVYLTNSFQFLNYIDIPLNLVYKFELAKKVALIVGVGPYISFFYDGKENSTTVGPNNYYSSTGNITNLPVGDGPGQYKTLDYGVNALAGIYLGGSFITANFSRGLQNAYQDSTYSGTFKNQVFSITLGVYLGERKKKPENKNDSTDEDGDGIIDKVDFCPTVPGLKKYNGCPIPDSDCDSINDEEDKCPLVAGLRRYNGCPIPDTDGDSVNDEEDKCPTAKGLVKYKGCPIPFDETLAVDSISGDTMIYYIYYDPNKIRTNVKGVTTLNKIRNLLKTNETLNIKISGYSDKNNSAKIAFKQSANRAIIVRNYMKKDSVAASRMKTHYWGSKKALASRIDKLDQWKDRRVEIAVYQKIKKIEPIPNDQDTTNNNEAIIKPRNKKTIVRKNNQTVVYSNNIADTTNSINVNNSDSGVANINSNRKAADNNISETSNDKVAAVKYKNVHTKKSNQSVSNNNSIDTTGVDNAIIPAASNNKNYPNKKINAVNGQQIRNNSEIASDTSNTNININGTSITKSKQQTTNNNLSNTAIVNNNKTLISEKNNQSADNNNASKNSELANNSSSTLATSENVNSNKNTNVVKKSNQQLLTDTVNNDGTDQTISKIPPSQIDDTDRVLDCYTIYFDPNQSILNSASFDILDHIRDILKNDSTLYIGISGYSERIGSEKSAQKLSQDRAYISRDYMNSYGVTMDRIRVSYWGSKIPVADDSDPYQQWENRRVEICIYVYPK